MSVLSRGRALLAIAAAALATAACGDRGQPAAEPAVVAAATAAPETVAPLERLPLAPPLRVTSNFGEFRGGHYHAGLDFSTSQAVGVPVHAPFDGWVERIRASGAGYGQALYLRAADGRTVLLGHLDAFDGAHGDHLAAVQESTGHYEQDLALDSLRFMVKAGERVAWSGESGAGPPHLHLELRHGAMSYHPGRFGLGTPDSLTPVIRALVVEPIDDRSFVQRSSAPRRVVGSRPDTLVVEGRVRVWVDTRDPGSGGARLAPYAATLADGADSVVVRFDRVAWDADMTSVEWVYDGTGRVAAGRPLALWAAPGYHPGVVVRPASGEGGTLEVAPEAPARVVEVTVRDLAGNTARRRLVLRGARPDERGPDTTAAAPAARPARASFALAPVREGFVRVTLAGAPGASRGVTIGWDGDAPRAASRAGARWTAVLPWPTREGSNRLVALGRAAGLGWRREQEFETRVAGTAAATLERPGALAWRAEPGALFEPALVVAPAADSTLPAGPGLVGVSAAVALEPATLPLRSATRVELPVPERWRRDPRVGLYHRRGASWNLVAPAGGGAVAAGEVRALGRFALLADTVAPAIGLARVRRGTAAPYSRWMLSMALIERGSGVDANATELFVDGARVPAEWDRERGVLRWRPRARPARGSHRYEVIARDRAGNERRRRGTFVIA